MLQIAPNFGAKVPARGFDFIGDQFTVEGYFNRQKERASDFDMTVSGILLTTLTAFLLGSNLSRWPGELENGEWNKISYGMEWCVFERAISSNALFDGE